jgi:copper chaperone CopZ
MNTNTLPTEELKKYGIINQDNTFSQKLSPDDIQKFLQGYTIVADNDRNRATFQLVDNNSRLNVIHLERDRSIKEILKNSISGIVYTNVHDLSGSTESKISVEKKAFIFDKENNKIVEFDFIKNSRELTAIIADTKNSGEIKNYLSELQKLQAFLQDKIDQFPEMAKKITNDLNIVTKEIKTVDGIFMNGNNSQKQEKTDVQMNVNDPDAYQDANRIKEENEELEENEKRSRGFRR